MGWSATDDATSQLLNDRDLLIGKYSSSSRSWRVYMDGELVDPYSSINAYSIPKNTSNIDITYL